MRNASFTDYLLPTMLDMPDVVASPHRGAGSAWPRSVPRAWAKPPCISSTPAVVAAIRDAIGKDLLPRTRCGPYDICL